MLAIALRAQAHTLGGEQSHRLRTLHCMGITARGSCNAAAAYHDRSRSVHISSLCLLQVRFHPTNSNLVASGSLDYQVRLWDVSSGQCINHHDFGASQCVLGVLYWLCCARSERELLHPFCMTC